jgi:hypothetical protein
MLNEAWQATYKDAVELASIGTLIGNTGSNHLNKHLYECTVAAGVVCSEIGIVATVVIVYSVVVIIVAALAAEARLELSKFGAHVLRWVGRGKGCIRLQVATANCTRSGFTRKTLLQWPRRLCGVRSLQSNGIWVLKQQNAHWLLCPADCQKPSLAEALPHTWYL